MCFFFLWLLSMVATPGGVQVCCSCCCIAHPSEFKIDWRRASSWRPGGVSTGARPAPLRRSSVAAAADRIQAPRDAPDFFVPNFQLQPVHAAARVGVRCRLEPRAGGGDASEVSASRGGACRGFTDECDVDKAEDGEGGRVGGGCHLEGAQEEVSSGGAEGCTPWKTSSTPNSTIHTSLCRLVFGVYRAAGNSTILAGCTKLFVAIFSSRNTWVDLYRIGEEDGSFYPHILLGGIMEASTQNLISNFASKMIAAWDIMQQCVATISVLFLIPCCVAIVVMVPCSDLVSFTMFGGAIQFSGSAIHSTEQVLVRICSCTCCTRISLSDDRHDEDTVSKLFGLCHRRWTTAPPLLILRFNSRDTLSLSSVKAIRYLQLNFQPRVHIPDRPSREPLAGHQLDRTFVEALEDCRCGNFESGLSTDDRTPYGSICDLLYLLHEFRSTSCCTVRLGTHLSCSTVESHVMLCNCP